MIWPLLAYFALVVVLVAAILFVSYLSGQIHSQLREEPYEGGIVSERSARLRSSILYYLVAIFSSFPSFAHIQTLPLLSRGLMIPDLVVILGSLDFVLADIGR